VRDVERNGHHYFRGLGHLPSSVADDLVATLPSLYEQDGDLRRLKITDGSLDLTGLVDAPGFGGLLGSTAD
jgi:hypothetical protein